MPVLQDYSRINEWVVYLKITKLTFFEPKVNKQLSGVRREKCNTNHADFLKRVIYQDRSRRKTDLMTNYIERIIEGDKELVVELSFKRVGQFFDPDDQSPVKSRDLSGVAQNAMVTAIIDRELKKPLHYIIRFPASQVTEEIKSDLPEAVKTYFIYRCEGARRNLRVLIKKIKYGLIFGLSFSAVLLAIGIYLYNITTDPVLADIIIGAIVIFCWVALWDPIDIFLHQYLIQKGTISICTKRVINSSIRVEKADVQPDGMPSRD
jgi:hypothetical protein